MRGKRSAWEKLIDEWRITPADAGKTLKALAGLRRHQDHPRGCGENERKIPKTRKAKGSPPRMRGKLGEWEQRKPIYRITPADAGKTVIMYSSFNPAKDHPRGCGENRKLFNKICADKGSPPRMRGKLMVSTPRQRQFRITPADAGKTATTTHQRSGV